MEMTAADRVARLVHRVFWRMVWTVALVATRLWLDSDITPT